MTEKVRWGILSTANIGRKRVIPAIHEARNSEVVAVASRNLERAQAFADEMNIPTAYGDYESLLNDPNVDAIYNPLPNSMHAEWAVKAAEAGKPMLCEKPLASNADEAQMMVDTFKQRGILFAEAFMYRFHPQTQRVKQMVEEGAIGQLKAISAAFTFTVRTEDNIRLDADLAGGSLMDVGCYCINLMRFITGEEPAHVRGIAQMGAGGVDDSFSGVLEFPSGVLGHFDSSLRTFGTHTYEIRGTEGRIRVDEAFVPNLTESTRVHVWQADHYAEVHINAGNQYTFMVEDFADALMNNRPPRFDPQDAVENMRVIDRLYAAAKS